LIGYKCNDGIWTETNPPHELTIPISEEEEVSLTRYSSVDAIKSLGVATSPSGGHALHLEHLRDKVLVWISRILNGHLPTAQVVLSYLYQLWPSLRYGLGTLTNDWNSASVCLERTDFRILPLLGVNCHINRSLCHLHFTFGGISLLDLAVEQHICRVNMFVQHYGSQSIVGKKLMSSMHWLQLQIGCVECPLLADFDKWGHLAPVSWIISFWESLHRCPGGLEIEFEGVCLQREGDISLMVVPDQCGLTMKDLASFNHCRCHGNLLLLSDVTNAAGTNLERRFLFPHFTAHVSLLSFPPEVPTVEDWTVWCTF
jgi:hypothetical protein